MAEVTNEERRKNILLRTKRLRAEALEDVKFNKAELDKQFDTSEKVGRWIDKRQEWVSLLRSYELKRCEAWKKAFEFYRTDYPVKLDNKEEFKNMISCDPAYADIADLHALVNEVVDFIDATILNLKSRAFEMQNFFHYIKFLHGG